MNVLFLTRKSSPSLLPQDLNMSDTNQSASFLSLCENAESLSRNVYLNALLLLRIWLFTGGLFLLVVLMKVQGKQLVVHTNAHIMLLNHHFSLILQCVCGIVDHLKTFMGFRSESECELLVTMNFCIPFRLIGTASAYATVMSLGVMAVERYWASMHYRTYEKSGAALGITLATMQWMISFFIGIAYIFDADWNQPMDYGTLVTSKNELRLAVFLLILSVVELSAIICFFKLISLNKRRRIELTSGSLTEKYQINENIRALQLMIPMILTHVFCFIPPLCILAGYFVVSSDLSQKNYPIFEESLNSTPIYCAALPIVLFWHHRVLRITLWRALRLKKVKPVDQELQAQIERDRHFESLKLAWANLDKKLATNKKIKIHHQ